MLSFSPTKDIQPNCHPLLTLRLAPTTFSGDWSIWHGKYGDPFNTFLVLRKKLEVYYNFSKTSYKYIKSFSTKMSLIGISKSL